ncbi:MAG: trypsin-like peptidase domain-containing protein [Oscillospiraceae bacterium]|nr:trypsin-like peptidase domain-containing protein [Oscillospiraceae bacterium]
MRKKKKIVQSLAAGILTLGLCASVVPVGASAAYDRYDVNHDGAVNINDVIYFNHYLIGEFSVVSSSDLDINQNKIIDIADSLEIMARIVGGSTSVKFVDITKDPDFVQTIPDELLAESGEDDLFPSSDIAEPYVIAGPRTYYKYNCTTGTCTTYGLQPELKTQTSFLNADEPDSINAISDDNYYRVNGNGMDGVVRFRTNGVAGTGFIVGDHTIATAAHCVINYRSTSTNVLDKFYTGATVQMCDTDGNLIATKYTVKEIHVPKAYVDSATREDPRAGSPVDYALLTVSEDLSAYTHFNLGVPSTDDINNMSEVPIFASGFPGDAPDSAHVYTSVGYEHEGQDSSEQQFWFTNHVAGGISGGPVYTVTDVCKDGKPYERMNTVLSICGGSTSTASVGVAMNSFLLAFYKKNPNIGY